jgi:hypothetical protein
MDLLIMSELTDYYPGEGLFEQCTWFQTGPPPVALTAANQIVLPVMTLRDASPTTTQSPSTPPNTLTTPTTTARPADTDAGTTPSRTSVPQTAVTKISSLPEKSDDSTARPPPNDVPEESEKEPTVAAPEDSDTLPTQDSTPEESDEEPTLPTTQGSANPPAPSGNPDEKDDGPEASTIIVATSPLNTLSINDDSSGSVSTQDHEIGTEDHTGNENTISSATTPAPASSSALIAVVPGVTFQDGNGSPEVVVGG